MVESTRLIMRPMLPEDDEGMFLLDSDADVHEYIGKNPVKTIQESRDVIIYVRNQYLETGIGRWTMLHKATGEFIGWIGFKLMKEQVNGHVDFYDFGYRLRKEFWGKGYATEGSLAMLQFGAETLQLKKVYAMTDINNLASRRVLEKAGFKFAEIFNYDAEPTWRKVNEPTTWYEYTYE